MSGNKNTGRAVVVGEYSGADSTILLNIDQRVDILKKSGKWWYVSDGTVKGYFPAICLRELDPSELAALPKGWHRNLSSDNRVYYYNDTTGESQWEYPKVAHPPPPPPPPKGSRHSHPAVAKTAAPTTMPALVKVSPPLHNHSTTSDGHNVLTPPPLLSVRPRHTPHNSMTDIPAPPTPVGPFGAELEHLESMREEDEGEIARAALFTDGDDELVAVSASPSPPRYRQDQTQRKQDKSHTPLPGALKEDIERFSIQGFADQHFNSHKKWTLFRGRQKLKPEELLSFSKTGIRQSLTRLCKSSESFAVKLFPKILAIVEGDKKRSSPESCEESLAELLAGIDAQVRTDRFVIDEVFCQIIKECTNNPSPTSTERGWALLYACLLCFSPSRELGKYLYQQSWPLRQSRDAIGGFAICVNKIILQQLQSCPTLPGKIPVTELSIKTHIDPVRRYHIPETLYGCPVECVVLWERVQLVSEGLSEDLRSSTLSMLGRDTVCGAAVDVVDQLPTLPEVLSLDQPPNLLALLCDAVVKLGAAKKPGIFREAANVGAVRGYLEKLETGQLDCLRYVGDSSNDAAGAGISVVREVLVACDLLKIWFRKLPEPIVPYTYYESCVKAGLRGDKALANEILSSMPPLYRATLAYLCCFIKYISQFSAVTRMEVANLTLVFAPNCIKNPIDDMTAIAMNAESEKRCLQLFVDILGGRGDSWPPP